MMMKFKFDEDINGLYTRKVGKPVLVQKWNEKLLDGLKCEGQTPTAFPEIMNIESVSFVSIHL